MSTPDSKMGGAGSPVPKDSKGGQHRRGSSSGSVSSTSRSPSPRSVGSSASVSSRKPSSKASLMSRKDFLNSFHPLESLAGRISTHWTTYEEARREHKKASVFSKRFDETEKNLIRERNALRLLFREFIVQRDSIDVSKLDDGARYMWNFLHSRLPLGLERLSSLKESDITTFLASTDKKEELISEADILPKKTAFFASVGTAGIDLVDKSIERIEQNRRSALGTLEENVPMSPDLLQRGKEGINSETETVIRSLEQRKHNFLAFLEVSFDSVDSQAIATEALSVLYAELPGFEDTYRQNIDGICDQVLEERRSALVAIESAIGLISALFLSEISNIEDACESALTDSELGTVKLARDQAIEGIKAIRNRAVAAVGRLSEKAIKDINALPIDKTAESAASAIVTSLKLAIEEIQRVQSAESNKINDNLAEKASAIREAISDLGDNVGRHRESIDTKLMEPTSLDLDPKNRFVFIQKGQSVVDRAKNSISEAGQVAGEKFAQLLRDGSDDVNKAIADISQEFETAVVAINSGLTSKFEQIKGEIVAAETARVATEAAAAEEVRIAQRAAAIAAGIGRVDALLPPEGGAIRDALSSSFTGLRTRLETGAGAGWQRQKGEIIAAAELATSQALSAINVAATSARTTIQGLQDVTGDIEAAVSGIIERLQGAIGASQGSQANAIGVATRAFDAAVAAETERVAAERAAAEAAAAAEALRAAIAEGRGRVDELSTNAKTEINQVFEQWKGRLPSSSLKGNFILRGVIPTSAIKDKVSQAVKLAQDNISKVENAGNIPSIIAALSVKIEEIKAKQVTMLGKLEQELLAKAARQAVTAAKESTSSAIIALRDSKIAAFRASNAPDEFIRNFVHSANVALSEIGYDYRKAESLLSIGTEDIVSRVETIKSETIEKFANTEGKWQRYVAEAEAGLTKRLEEDHSALAASGSASDVGTTVVAEPLSSRDVLVTAIEKMIEEVCRKGMEDADELLSKFLTDKVSPLSVDQERKNRVESASSVILSDTKDSIMAAGVSASSDIETIDKPLDLVTIKGALEQNISEVLRKQQQLFDGLMLEVSPSLSINSVDVPSPRPPLSISVSDRGPGPEPIDDLELSVVPEPPAPPPSSPPPPPAVPSATPATSSPSTEASVGILVGIKNHPFEFTVISKAEAKARMAMAEVKGGIALAVQNDPHEYEGRFLKRDTECLEARWKIEEGETVKVALLQQDASGKVSDCTDNAKYGLTEEEKCMLALQQARMALDNYQEGSGRLVIGGRDVEQACRVYAAVEYLAKQDPTLADIMKKSFGRTDASKLITCSVPGFAEMIKAKKNWLAEIPKDSLEKIAKSRWDSKVLGHVNTHLQKEALTPSSIKDRLQKYKTPSKDDIKKYEATQAAQKSKPDPDPEPSAGPT